MSGAPKRRLKEELDSPAKVAREEGNDTRSYFFSSDILNIIFNFLTFRRRIGVMSLVCKQWRTATFHSVARLPVNHRLLNQIDDKDLGLKFPSLSHLDFSRNFGDDRPIIPDTITSIYYEVDVEDERASQDGQTLRQITARGFPLQDVAIDLVSACEGVPELLQSCTSTIRALTLGVFHGDASVPHFDVMQLIGAMHFPHLRSLEITGYGIRDWPAARSFISSHASTLTSIDFGGNEFPHHALLGAPMPNLRFLHLDLETVAEVTTLMSDSGIALLKQLTVFTAHTSVTSLSTLPLSLLALVTSFVLKLNTSEEDVMWLGQYVDRIESLTVRVGQTRPWLELLLKQKLWAKLRIFTLVSQDTDISSEVSLGDVLRGCSFPALRSFEWSTKGGFFETTILAINLLLAASPLLSYLIFSITRVVQEAGFDSLCQLMRTLFRRGLDGVTILYLADKELQDLQKHWLEMVAAVRAGRAYLLSTPGWADKLRYFSESLVGMSTRVLTVS